MYEVEFEVSGESLESEAEFWTGLDEKPMLLDRKDTSLGLLEASTKALTAFSSLEEGKALELRPELYRREGKGASPRPRSRTPLSEDVIQRRFDKSLEMVRKAKKIEIANSSVQVKHHLTREFEGKLSALSQSFHQQKQLQNYEMHSLKRDLASRISQQVALQRIIEEQETVITLLRLKAEAATPVPSLRCESPLKGPKAHSDSAVELRVEVDLAKAQVESLQHVIDDYRKELDSRMLTCKKLENQIKALTEKYEKEKSDLHAEIARAKAAHIKETEALSNQLKSMKSEADGESSVHEEIQARLQHAIASLQEELRTAKLLLTHPRLRAKVVTRLHDVDTAIPALEGRAMTAPSSATPGPRSLRARRLYGNQTIKIWNHMEHRSYMQSMEMERAASTQRERAVSAYHSTATMESKRGSL